MDDKDNELLGEEPGEDEPEELKKVVGLER